MNNSLISPKYLTVFIAAITFVSIALHDTKVDTMTTMAIAIPIIAAYEASHALNLNSADGSHTHVEKVSVSNTMKQNTASAPALQSNREEKKYRSHKYAPRGNQSTNNYSLPLAT